MIKFTPPPKFFKLTEHIFNNIRNDNEDFIMMTAESESVIQK